MGSTPLYRALAQLVGAVHRCEKNANGEWRARHRERIDRLVKRYLPSGSGFDSGTTLDVDASTEEKLVLHTSFHHMDEGGSYDGWTEHPIRIYPSLAFGFRTTIGGRDRNGIKDYIGECIHTALGTDVSDDQAWGPTTSEEKTA